MREKLDDRRHTTIWIALGILLGLLLTMPHSFGESRPEDRSAPAGSASVVPAEPPAPEAEQAPPAARILGDQTVFFQDARVEADEIIRGDFVCIGCNLEIEGEVTGDVIVVGGRVRLAHDLEGELVTVGSVTVLEPGITIDEDMVAVFSSLTDGGATVRGDRVYIPLPFPVGSGERPFQVLSSMIGWIKLLKLSIVFLVLMLVAATAPARVRLLGEELGPSLGLAMVLGFIAHAVVLVAYLLLAMSVVGAPLIPVLALAFIIARIVGRAGVLYLIGQRLGQGFHWQLSVLAAVALGFVPYALLTALPFFFGLFGLVLGLLIAFVLKIFIDWPAMGIVLLTAGGGRRRQRPPLTPPPVATEPAAAAPPPAV